MKKNNKEIEVEKLNLTEDEKIIERERYELFLKSLAENSFYAKSPNKKSSQFNMTFHRNDLIVMDELAKKLSVKRSEIIGALVSDWVVKLFLEMPQVDIIPILRHVEKEISEHYVHHYEGKTWEWKLSFLHESYGYVEHDEAQIKKSLITRKESK
ncbi:hypothetical protein [Vibrio rarus]|uniref:hypothetical protein n=1 Tax=Vibrio rarus TaxID=413403 RepID=UPI0021C263F5|nr:hypothetical protein [Vibrio rarus]